ncbi:MAG: hypothetical protein QOJ54_1020 [Aliidongia sp.]|jgi:hypothetical protein|nr:hypothetical protein [Aliidongia sp.]
MRPIDFERINEAAVASLENILARWLSDGTRRGREWDARNPRRHDRRPGSFRVNIDTGKWSDFATGDSGGDPISLAAYLFSLTQLEAAMRVASMLTIDPYVADRHGR